jgi:tetratricopeptide (TPR) repeat protein
MNSLMMKCDICGASSELEAGFVRAPSKKKTLCVTCILYNSRRGESASFKILLLGAVVSVGFIFLADRWFLFNVILFCISFYLSIVPHELGHLLGAILTRQEILQITLGSGRLLYSTKIRGVYFEILSYPTEGMLFRKNKGMKLLKLRDFITVLFGPLANLVIAWFIWIVFTEQVKHTSLFEEPAPLLALLLANGLMGMINLLPFSFKSNFGELHSDGKQLLRIPFMSASQLEDRFRHQAIAASFLALHNKDLAKCEQLCAEALAAYPADAKLMLIKSVLLCQRHQYRAAREFVLTALKDDAITGMERAVAENNIAWCDYALADPELLDEADRLSESAIKNVPWALSVRSTRGAILIATGRIEEGIALLEDKRLTMESTDNRASVACSLSMGYAAKGGLDKAREFLQQAETLDPDCVLLERARKRININQ